MGGRLAERLRADGVEVRCLVRDRSRAERLTRLGCELHEGDALEEVTLSGAGHGVEVAYYLIHSMGRGDQGDFSEREQPLSFSRPGRIGAGHQDKISGQASRHGIRTMLFIRD